MKKVPSNSKQKTLPSFSSNSPQANPGHAFLSAVRLKREVIESFEAYPFCVPAVRHLERLEFHPAVSYGKKSLHAQSHGEAFLSLLTNRLQEDGVYLFDEPEAALSPQRQLSVLTLLHRLVYHHSQLIIATHSPILLAYPHARIYEFSEQGIQEVKYTNTEHFHITKDFLNRPERMLELLLNAEDHDLKSKERK